MTSEQAIKSLSPAQRRLFEDLQKRKPHNNEPGIYLTRRERISAAVLMRMGWVEHCGHEFDAWKRWRLTALGKLIASVQATTPTSARRVPTARPRI